MLLVYASTILIGIATFILARTMFLEEDQFKAGESLEEGGKKEKVENHGIILKYSRPFFKRYISPIVSNMKNKKTIRDKYKKKLANAGLTQVLTPDDFFAFKLFLIVGFPIFYLFLRWFLEETWPLTAAPLAGILGFFYPDIWIDGKIASRKEDVLAGFPFIVDMLALSIEAGLDFVAAIAKVVEKAPPGAITEEFEMLLKELRVGAAREESLRSLAWRCDLLPVTSFTAALIAANSVGASVGPILKGQSSELRGRRSTDAEKKGAQAAIKVLFAMLFIFTPAVVIMIGSPMIVEFVAK